jgi:hypothetical protein
LIPSCILFITYKKNADFFYLDTSFEFKIVVFEGGKFKEWEYLPGNANRSYTTRHWKTRLEISGHNLSFQELALKKHVPSFEMNINDNGEQNLNDKYDHYKNNCCKIKIIYFIFSFTEKVRKKVKIKKMNPFEIARESDVRN